MKWSFSMARSFRQCQRGWYFKSCLASARSKDPARREAFVLSKLQSISSWRGKLVDRILSEELVPALRRRRPPTKPQLLAVAKTRFEKELAFARAHRIREPDIKVSDEDNVAAFYCIEYGIALDDAEVAAAWRDIEVALENLFKMEQIRAGLKSAAYVVAQRTLQFKFAGVNVIAVPDVIAFFESDPPMIVDWKVHAFGSRDYRLQLALYALSLFRCSPHRDFPSSLKRFSPTDTRLLEVQLLTGAEHAYSVDTRDMAELEDYVAASAAEMLSATGDLTKSELLAEDFPVTQWPEHCQRCAFRKICWVREAADGHA